MLGSRRAAAPAPTVVPFPTLPPAHDGRLELRVNHDGLEHLFQRQPLKLFLPRAPAGEPLTAVIANVSGGIVGGDRHEIDVRCAPGGALLVTGQAAEKVYRSAGPEARVDASLDVGPDAWLEWLPQGTILFDGCRLRRDITVRAAPTAKVLMGEIVVFGRTAMGEALTYGLFHDRWRFYLDQRLVWVDSLRLDDDIAATLASSAGFGGARAMATFVYASSDAPARLAGVRDWLADNKGAPIKAAATAFESLLVVRWLSTDAAALRAVYGAFWSQFRAASGRAARLPVLWQI